MISVAGAILPYLGLLVGIAQRRFVQRHQTWHSPGLDQERLPDRSAHPLRTRYEIRSPLDTPGTGVPLF